MSRAWFSPLLAGLALAAGPVSYEAPPEAARARAIEINIAWREPRPSSGALQTAETSQEAIEEPPALVDSATAGRWLWYLGIFTIVGSTVLRLLVCQARAAALLPSPDPSDAIEQGASRLAFGAALLLLLVVGPMRLYLQAASFVDPGERFTSTTVGIILRATSWGTGWMVQMAAIVLAALVSLWVIRSRVTGRVPAGSMAAALAVALTTPLTGHAVTGPWPPAVQVLLQGVHVLGGSVWLGTLLGLFAVGFKASSGLEPMARAQLIRGLVLRFSPVALTGAGTTVLAGSILAWLNVRSIPALWESNYGRALLLKVVTLGAVMALGAFNWRRVKPTLGTPASTQRLWRSAGLELALGALLLAITAVLVALPTPHM